MERDQPHKTQVISTGSTWTADFMTRDGEGDGRLAEGQDDLMELGTQETPPN
jgi:hypothetical protein